MKISVDLENGYLPDKYTKYSTEKVSGQPVISFPIHLADLPQETKYLAISLIDYDAVPRTGFPFIHWLIANVPVTNEIKEDLSRTFDGPQGKNSWVSRFYELSDEYVINHYAGPTPPDKPHTYTLMVYALDSEAELKNGFYYNEFLKAIKGKILAKYSVELPAKN